MNTYVMLVLCLMKDQRMKKEEILASRFHPMESCQVLIKPID